MRWKENVKVEREKGYRFIDDQKSKMIAKEDYFIIDAIEKGITDDEELSVYVAVKEHTDAVVSSFRLAQFILDYGEFISNDLGHMVIKP